MSAAIPTATRSPPRTAPPHCPPRPGGPCGTGSIRGGNRQLNRALYTIAITQIRGDTEGRAYYERKRAAGKTRREALRCLKRQTCLRHSCFTTMRTRRRLTPSALNCDRVTLPDRRLGWVRPTQMRHV